MSLLRGGWDGGWGSTQSRHLNVVPMGVPSLKSSAAAILGDLSRDANASAEKPTLCLVLDKGQRDSGRGLRAAAPPSARARETCRGSGRRHGCTCPARASTATGFVIRLTSAIEPTRAITMIGWRQ